MQHTSHMRGNKASESSAMQHIPGGPFLMGAEGWGPYEGPVREVIVNDFLIDATPVTNLDFETFVNATQYRTTAEINGSAHGYLKGTMQEIEGLCWRSYNTIARADHPVVLVSWHDSEAYAQWAGKRLPTEAEWEKAARGGLQQMLYPWGAGVPAVSLCNFGRTVKAFPATVPVGSFPANGYGLHDMAGNVWNWCADEFTIPGNKNLEVTSRIRKGGAFNVIQPFRLRCANRGAYDQDKYAINIGFRCARSI